MLTRLWIGSIFLCLLMPLSGLAATYVINTSGDWVTQLENAGVPDALNIMNDTIIVNAGVTLFMNGLSPDFNGVAQLVNNGILDNPTPTTAVFDFFNESDLINNNVIRGIDLNFFNNSDTGINNGSIEDLAQIQVFDQAAFTNYGTVANVEIMQVYRNATFTNFGNFQVDKIEFFRAATLINAGQWSFGILAITDQEQEFVSIFSCNPIITGEEDNVTIEAGLTPTLGPVPAGLACDDGNRDTQGETWDGDCNCLGGVEVPVFSSKKMFLFGLLVLGMATFLVFNPSRSSTTL